MNRRVEFKDKGLLLAGEDKIEKLVRTQIL